MKDNLFGHFNYSPTPLCYYPCLSSCLKLDLWVKHDDTFSGYCGGNKVRKLHYILYNAKKNNHNAVVTAGAGQSNHVRATALMCAKYGLKTIIIIHAKRPCGERYTGNLKLTKLVGADIRFVEMKEVAREMGQAMRDLIDQGYKPYYIWGGGHSVEGSYAYYDAIKELSHQLGPNNNPDYIVLASGTGTTQAGIIAGCNKFLPKTKVMGISIAREKERGVIKINESLSELLESLEMQYACEMDIAFDDSFVGEGYESVYTEIVDIIKWAAQTEGLILDPTYTGKAFYGLMHYIKEGIIPKGARVIFWHTGGLLNLLSNSEI